MQLKHNIPLIYIIGSLMWMRFFIPVLALFYIASQVPVEQFSFIMAIFALVTLLFEIPSGVLADLFGKKQTLLISRFLYVIEIFILCFADGFWMFLIAKVISGLGVSLSSGTNSALLYETLEKLGRESEHKQISGTLATITSISMAFVFIIGSMLFSIDYKLPAFASLPFISIGFILTFFLKEPYENTHKITFTSSINHFTQSLRYFISDTKLISLAIFSLPIATAISLSLSLSSVYFAIIHIPLFLIGTISFIGSLLMAFGSKKAHIFETRLQPNKSMFLIQTSIILSLILMMFTMQYIGVIWYLLIPFTAGFFTVIINHYMNEQVQKKQRTTMLSIRNMIDNIGIFIMFPLIGYVIKEESFFEAYLILAGFVLIVSSIYYFIKKK